MKKCKLEFFAKLIGTVFFFSLLFATGVQAQTITNNQSGFHDGYYYEYNKDVGNGTMLLKSGGSF